MKVISWLPNLVLLNNYENDWDKYLVILYDYYRKDFIEKKPIFRNNSIRVKRNPLYNGKEATFWHIIQKGGKEDDKIPDLRRSERIRWPKPIIEHSIESIIKIWENERHLKKGIAYSICIWCEKVEYLIILRKRSEYLLFWTSYPVTKNHFKRKLNKEYHNYIKSKGRSKSVPVTPSTHGR